MLYADFSCVVSLPIEEEGGDETEKQGKTQASRTGISPPSAEVHLLLEGKADGDEPLQADEGQHPVGVTAEERHEVLKIAASVVENVVGVQLVVEELDDQRQAVGHSQQGHVERAVGHGQHSGHAGRVGRQAYGHQHPDVEVC